MTRIGIGAFGSGIWLGLALATGAAPATAAPTGSDLVKWIAANTDLSPAQVVIPGPEYVYTLEPLGSPSATGEQIALVRTELLEPAPGEPPQAKSWEAHILFDCRRGQMREVRGASYPEPNRRGAPVRDTPGDDWITPNEGQPAIKLMAAACSPRFEWPLRTVIADAKTQASAPSAATTKPAALAPAQEVVSAPPPPSAPRPQAGAQTILMPASDGVTPTAVAPPTTPSPAAESGASATLFGVQVARGPSNDGARRALGRAQKTLGELAAGATANVESSQVGSRRRFTAVLWGFPTAAAADRACDALTAADQECFVRSPDDDAVAEAAPLSTPDAVSTGAYAVQVARGPNEEGARRALAAARKTLGDRAGGLSATTEESQDRGRRRFTAVLSGFPTAKAAAEACADLREAGQLCLTRRPAKAARADADKG